MGEIYAAKYNRNFISLLQTEQDSVHRKVGLEGRRTEASKENSGNRIENGE